MTLPERHAGIKSPAIITRILPVIFIFLALSCGKKGGLTLSSYERPVAPSSLSVSQREGTALLSWGYPAEKEAALSGFIILRSSGAGFERIAFPEGNLRHYADTDVVKGTAYSYKLLSQSKRGVLSEDTIPVSLTIVTPPTPPLHISWNAGADEIVFSWEKNGDSTYNVYKSFKKGAYGMKPDNRSPLSVTSFKDAVYPDRTVFYTFRSLTDKGVRVEGPPSREIEVSPGDLVPPAPHDVRYFAAADRIYLYWMGPDVSWVRGFRVYRRFSDSEFTAIAETQIPTFLDTQTPFKKRDYRVAALGPVTEGPAVEISGVVYTPEQAR